MPNQTLARSLTVTNGAKHTLYYGFTAEILLVSAYNLYFFAVAGATEYGVVAVDVEQSLGRDEC